MKESDRRVHKKYTINYYRPGDLVSRKPFGLPYWDASKDWRRYTVEDFGIGIVLSEIESPFNDKVLVYWQGLSIQESIHKRFIKRIPLAVRQGE